MSYLDKIKPISTEEAFRFAFDKQELALSPQQKDLIRNCRVYLENKIKNDEAAYYGINTGFGSLCDVKISREELSELQENLVMSHACGLGNHTPKEIIRLMLFLKVRSLSYGHSGIRMETVESLINFYNEDILPVVYEQGSLGASGDLAPLAHLALPLLGKGEIWQNAEPTPASGFLESHNLKPLKLGAKEGLALLNGTQFMSSYGVYILNYAKNLFNWADLISALSIEAYDVKLDPFYQGIHEARPHKGQKYVAAKIREILKDSELVARPKEQVQDAYSFRCIPQVHGASRDAMKQADEVFEKEINSVTDNPNIFPEEDLIVSGGNFHGQVLAIQLDKIAIALGELGSISERRIYKMLGGQRGLPAFLVAKPGVNSGLMIPQYTAASIVSQNKQLCSPSSIDSITSSNGQEDHVSMGANAASKALKVMQNLEKILAIELFTAAQALDFRETGKCSTPTRKLHEAYREKVSFVEKDRVLHYDLKQSIAFLKNIQASDFTD